MVDVSEILEDTGFNLSKLFDYKVKDRTNFSLRPISPKPLFNPKISQPIMIINQTKNKVISQKEIYCHNFLSQAQGLIFRKKQNLVMIFRKERKIHLHNWFVFYPIDVLVLDTNKKIIEIKRAFKPFTFWNSKKKGKYLIELGFPSEYQVGDLLKIKKDSIKLINNN